MAGFTLIEAVAALAICAATLVVILAIRSELMRQSARSSQTASANVLAGKLIAEWRMGDLIVSANDSKSGIDDDFNLHWDVTCRVEEVQSQTSDGSGQADVIFDCLDVNISAPGLPEAGDRSLVNLRAWRLAGSGGQ